MHNETTRRLVQEAARFVVLIDRIEGDNPPRSHEYDESRAALVDAITAALAADTDAPQGR